MCVYDGKNTFFVHNQLYHLFSIYQPQNYAKKSKKVFANTGYMCYNDRAVKIIKKYTRISVGGMVSQDLLSQGSAEV